MTYSIERYPAGPLDTNGYLLINDNECLIIDPSLNSTALLFDIKERGLKPLAILLTHGHFDHFLGMYDVWDHFGKDLPLYLHPDEKELIGKESWNGCDMIGDCRCYKGDFISFTEGPLQIGPFKLKVFHTPGHTPGGVSLYDGTNCFTGDTLFAGSIGRSDWHYSDGVLLVKMIHEKLFTLPDETIIWPGHAMRSTIGREKKFNPLV